jgi:hypothetical protein
MNNKIANTALTVITLIFNVLFLVLLTLAAIMRYILYEMDYVHTFQVYLGSWAPSFSYFVVMILLLVSSIFIIAENKLWIGWLLQLVGTIPWIYVFILSEYIYLLPENQYEVFLIPSSFMLWCSFAICSISMLKITCILYQKQTNKQRQ